MNSTVLHVAIVLVLVVLVYSNTLDAPFVFDDSEYVVSNPAIRDTSFLTDPQALKGQGLSDNSVGMINSRRLAVLSFAINYRLHGLGVRGYHIINIAIHAANALLLYVLVLIALRTPVLSGSSLNAHGDSIALFAALLFAVHPLQTQAVTYISQRFTSLATMFYLLSIVLYATFRLREGRRKRTALYVCSVLSGLLAMNCKEIAFTLPVNLALFEFVFFSGRLRKRLLYLSAPALTMLVVPFVKLGLGTPLGETLAAKGDFKRLEYLVTQPRVLLTYLRLFLFPINQNLDYGYPVQKSLAPGAMESLPVVLSLLVVAFRCLRKNEGRGLKLIGFGIIWFFVALSVESSVIPLADLIFEHRAYLPSVGVFAAVVGGVFAFGQRRQAALLLSALVLVFAFAAHERNKTWLSEQTLLEDVISKSPLKARPHYNLGVLYQSKGLSDKALEKFRDALSVEPDHAGMHNNLGVFFFKAGRYGEAEAEFLRAVEIDPAYLKAYNNMGINYLEQGKLREAALALGKAVRLDPDYAQARFVLGIVYDLMGLRDGAIAELEAAVSLEPWNEEYRARLGEVRRRQ